MSNYSRYFQLLPDAFSSAASRLGFIKDDERAGSILRLAFLLFR